MSRRQLLKQLLERVEKGVPDDCRYEIDRVRFTFRVRETEGGFDVWAKAEKPHRETMIVVGGPTQQREAAFRAAARELLKQIRKHWG